MRPGLVKHVLFPLHERLVGRRTPRFVHELEWSQWASPDELRELQRVKLATLLGHAYDVSSFHRRRIDEAGADPRNPDGFEMLRALPTLDKAGISRSIDEMIWRGAPGGVFESHTGGSSGEPLRFFVDRRRQAYDQAARIRTHRWFGVDLGQRELYLWGSPIERRRTDTLRRWRDALFNHRLLDAFHMSCSRMDAYLDAWDAFRPACLFGYPSSIAMLTRRARTVGRKLDRRRLKAIFVTGEVCYPHDRKTIEEYFEVPVADGYGSREAGFIAHQCTEGRMHVMAENVVLEIFTGDRPAPPGESGEIVVTHLDAYAMPMIRYRTGDVGRLLPQRCLCGRGLPLMDVIAGRTTDFLCTPDGDVKHALSIIYPLRETRGIRQFRVVQHENFAVTIDVVCDDRAATVTRESIERSVRPIVGEDVSLSVRYVASIPQIGSGKFRYVESRAIPASTNVTRESPHA
ncbi:MAG: phenylacetate--CoA ligase family protein [Planctomycetota bacterium]